MSNELIQLWGPWTNTQGAMEAERREWHAGLVVSFRDLGWDGCSLVYIGNIGTDRQIIGLTKKSLVQG